MLEGFTYAEFNNLKAFEDAVTEYYSHHDRTCREGGGTATKEFMTGLRKLCDEKVVALLDEVQTGLCRTGDNGLGLRHQTGLRIYGKGHGRRVPDRRNGLYKK